MPKHEALTGANLHEPKGVASATDNTVYTADGTGSGAWEVIFEEQTQLLSGTSSTITGLGDYAVIYITTPEISSSSNNNRWWEMQFGNSGGITSSAIYYSCGWFYAGIEDHPSESSLRFGLSYTSNPGAYVEQSVNLLFINFNKEAYTVGGGVSSLNRSQFAAGLGRQFAYYAREEKAYDRIRFTWTESLADGTFGVMGLKG